MISTSPIFRAPPYTTSLGMALQPTRIATGQSNFTADLTLRNVSVRQSDSLRFCSKCCAVTGQVGMHVHGNRMLFFFWLWT